MPSNKNALGAKRSQEFKDNLSKIMMGNKRCLGRKHTEETKEKISKAHRGEKAYNWMGGYKNDRERLNEMKKINTQNRRARKKDNGGVFTTAEWEDLKTEFDNTCPSCCQKEPNIKLTIDHIIPIAKGGSGDIDNIQPLCGLCNSSKGIKIITYKPYSPTMEVI